jgi:hypothetical protein
VVLSGFFPAETLERTKNVGVVRLEIGTLVLDCFIASTLHIWLIIVTICADMVSAPSNVLGWRSLRLDYGLYSVPENIQGLGLLP